MSEQRGYEYVPRAEWPVGHRSDLLKPLNSALDEMRKFRPGEGVKLAIPAGVTPKLFQGWAHTYAARRGFNVTTKTLRGCLYITRKEAR